MIIEPCVDRQIINNLLLFIIVFFLKFCEVKEKMGRRAKKSGDLGRSIQKAKSKTNKFKATTVSQ